MLDVDVVPFERFELASAHAEIDGDRDEPAPKERNLFAGDERDELTWVEKALRLRSAAIGSFDVRAGVVLSSAEREQLRAAGILEHLGDDRPHVNGSLPADLAGERFGVQLFDEPFDVFARHPLDGSRPEFGEDVILQAPLVVFHR
ncbi:MAG TPA: hypothetical protein VK540_22090 [Polyangiaceae bacterium]|nr:hypothetical protein [Polyangiaceae bacterium]